MLVDGPGHQLLAGATLPGDQHGKGLVGNTAMALYASCIPGQRTKGQRSEGQVRVKRTCTSSKDMHFVGRIGQGKDMHFVGRIGQGKDMHFVARIGQKSTR
jgi:hypothetical protein